MDYRQAKIKGIIREAIVKAMLLITSQMKTKLKIKEMGNPYANISEGDEFHDTVNNLTDSTISQLKELGAFDGLF